MGNENEIKKIEVDCAAESIEEGTDVEDIPGVGNLSRPNTEFTRRYMM